ncbi:uncharacterized protein LOC133191601 [Saccostrea echinata]|uniref:uncharacterized protein LOC133191601 n=1 Tax=Saccostrea echinata TaxID=191078 RepID=UPI002A815EA2|nr:uncharacterized protein LOC133191601 [Saccostrea echinata]
MDVLENDFIDYQYPLSVLEKLKTFWLTKTLCDATLEAGPVKVYVHRLILLAAIPGLTQMQISNSEKPLELILPASIKTDALNNIVHYWYTGTLHLTPQNAPWVEQIVHLLGLESLFAFCKQYHNYLRQKKILIPACELFTTPVVVLCELERVTQLHYLESKDHLSHFLRQHSSLIPVVVRTKENVSHQEALETKVKNDGNEIENPELALNHSDFTLGTFPQSSLKGRLHFQICRSTGEGEESNASVCESHPSPQISASQTPASTQIPGLVDLSYNNDNVVRSNTDSLPQLQTRAPNIPNLQEMPETNARTGPQCVEQNIKQEPLSDSEMESCQQGDNLVNHENSGDKRDSVYKFISRLVDKYMEGDAESTNWSMNDKQLLKNQTPSCKDTTTISLERILKEKEKADRNKEFLEETNQKYTRTEQPLVIQYDTCPSCNLKFHSEDQLKAHLKLHLTLCPGTRSSEKLTPNSFVMNQRPSNSSSETLTPNSSVLNPRVSISSSEKLTPNSFIMNPRTSPSSSENPTPNSSVLNRRVSASSLEDLTPFPSVLNQKPTCSASLSEILTPSLNQPVERLSTDPSSDNQQSIGISSKSTDERSEDISSETEDFTAYCPLCLINFVSRKAYMAHLNTCYNTFHHRQQNKFMQKEWSCLSQANRVPFQSSSSGRIFSFVRPICTNSTLPTEDRCSVNGVVYDVSLPADDRSFVNSVAYTSSSLSVDVRNAENTDTGLTLKGSQEKNEVASIESETSLQRGNGDENLCGNTTANASGDLALSERAEGETVSSASCQTGPSKEDLKIRITDVRTLKGLPEETNIHVTAATLEHQKICINQTLGQVDHQNIPCNNRQKSMFEVTAEGNKLFIKKKASDKKGQSIAVNDKGQNKAVNDKGQSIAVNDKGQSKAVNDKGQSIAVNDKGQSIAVNDKGQGIAVNDKGQSIAVNDEGQSIAVNENNHSKALNGKSQSKALNWKVQDRTVIGKECKNQICEKPKMDVTRKRGRRKQNNIETSVQCQKNQETGRRQKRKNGETAPPVSSASNKDKPSFNSQNSGQGTVKIVISQTPIKKLTNIVAAVTKNENTFKLKRKYQGLDGDKTKDKNSTEIKCTVVAESNNTQGRQQINQQSSRKFYRFKNQSKEAVVHQSSVHRSRGHRKSPVVSVCATADLQTANCTQSPAQQTQVTTMYNSALCMSPALNVNSQMHCRRSSIQEKIASVYRKNCIIIPKEWKKWKEDTSKLEGTGAPCQYTGTGAPCQYTGTGAPSQYTGTGAPCQYTGTGAPCQYTGTGAPSQYAGTGVQCQYTGTGAPSHYTKTGAPSQYTGTGVQCHYKGTSTPCQHTVPLKKRKQY